LRQRQFQRLARADDFGCDFTQLALPGARMASFVYA
jgi:hypothetical protein